MNKDDLLEMIRKEINSLAFETLRNNKKEESKKAFKPKGLSEEDVEYNLFYGGNKPNKDKLRGMPVTIKEGYNSGLPQITTAEITEFEDSFEGMLQELDGASVVFDNQSNGYPLKVWMSKDGGIDAASSGKIIFGDRGTINWSYSLVSGINVTTEDLRLEQGNKRILEKLYNNYDAWQKDWREKLTIQPGVPGGEEMAPEAPVEAPVAPEGGAEEVPAA